jgi:hypothetical protein
MKPRESELYELEVVGHEVKMEEKIHLWSIGEEWSSMDFEVVSISEKKNRLNTESDLWTKVYDRVCKGNVKKRSKRKKKGPDKKVEVVAKTEVLGVNKVDLKLENKTRKRKKEKAQQEEGINDRNLKMTEIIENSVPGSAEISRADTKVVMWPEKSMETGATLKGNVYPEPVEDIVCEDMEMERWCSQGKKKDVKKKRKKKKKSVSGLCVMNFVWCRGNNSWKVIEYYAKDKLEEEFACQKKREKKRDIEVMDESGNCLDKDKLRNLRDGINCSTTPDKNAGMCESDPNGNFILFRQIGQSKNSERNSLTLIQTLMLLLGFGTYCSILERKS